MTRSKLKVLEIAESEIENWDNFVENAGASIFNESIWVKSIASVMEAGFKIIGCFRGNKLLGGCTLYITKGLEGRIAKFPPLTPYNGIVIVNKEGSEHIAHSVIEALAKYLERKFDYVILINHPSIVDVRPFIWQGWQIDLKYTYYKSLNDGLYKPLDSDIERRAEIAQEQGIAIQESDDAGIFYNLWVKSFERQRLKLSISKAQFLKLFNLLNNQNKLKMFLARTKEGIPVASNIWILDRGVLFYWLAVADPKFFNTNANQLLIKFAIESFKDSCPLIDFVGADIPSIAFYKSSLGVRLVPHYQVSKAMSPRAKIVRAAKQFYKTFRT